MMSFSKKSFAFVALALVVSSGSAETQLRGVATTTNESMMDMLHRVLQFNIGGGDITGLSVTNSAGGTTTVVGSTPTTGMISNAEEDEEDEEEEEEDEDEDGELWGLNTFGTGNGEAGFMANGGVAPAVPTAPCPAGTFAKFNPETDEYFCKGSGEDDEDDRRQR